MHRYGTAACRCRRRPPCFSTSRDSRSACASARACSTSSSNPLPGSNGTRGLRQLTRGVLETETAHLLRRRPDERDARGLTSLCERCVLAQESVAGMNRLRTGLERRGDDAILSKITFRGRRGAM